MQRNETTHTDLRIAPSHFTSSVRTCLEDAFARHTLALCTKAYALEFRLVGKFKHHLRCTWRGNRRQGRGRRWRRCPRGHLVDQRTV